MKLTLVSSGKCISGCSSALAADLDDVCICCEVNQEFLLSDWRLLLLKCMWTMILQSYCDKLVKFLMSS